MECGDRPPSRAVDVRARVRAEKRYRRIGEEWVKGKEVEGAWVPDAPSKKFVTLPEAVAHELELTEQRRTTWANLKRGHQALGLRAQIRVLAKERTIAPLNAHATAEADRVIEAVRETSAPANANFSATDGAGSATDLRLQAKALTERARLLEREAARQEAQGRGDAAKAVRAEGFDAAGQVRPRKRRRADLQPEGKPKRKRVRAAELAAAEPAVAEPAVGRRRWSRRDVVRPTETAAAGPGATISVCGPPHAEGADSGASASAGGAPPAQASARDDPRPNLTQPDPT